MATKKKSTTSTKKVKKEVSEVKKEIPEIKEEAMENIFDEKKPIIEEKTVEEKPIIEEKSIIEEKHHSHKMSFFEKVLLLFTFICTLVYFVFHLIDNTSTLLIIINSLVLTLFSIIYLVICLTSRRKHKGIQIWGSILLIGFFITNIILSYNGESITIGRNVNFVGKSLTDAVKWANKNSIKINQDFEYSDMIPEYEVISQKVEYADNKRDFESITVAISEGPNPYKEVVVPSMITWNDERVLNFIKTNYLNNVSVEFVESDQVKDTVIEQSKSGNLRRNDEIKLKFSYGDEGNSDEVSLIDFTDKSKFEIEFFMKQHHLNYSFEEDYSNKIKKGYGMKQSVKAGEKVKVNGEKIVITISKGHEIKIPDFKGMTVTEITEWAIENRLKLEFIDKYDESVKKGKIISSSVKEGDVVEQGSTIKVYTSLGKLTMPKFKTIDDFHKWADKYEIKYQEEHEFSDSVEAGGVIRYSYKKGETIKNGETIIVVISDGRKKSVPDLDGLSKNDAIAKLEDVGLNYNFIYRNSDRTKNTVIAQSMSAGSEVSQGTTITITLSSGPASSGGGNNNSGGNNSGNNGGNSGNNNNSNPQPEPSPSPSPTPTCTDVTVFIYPELIDKGNPTGTCSKIKARYSNLNFTCDYVDFDGIYGGRVQNSDSIDGQTFTTCDTINLKIVNNG